MELTQEDLARRLRDAREHCELTQAEVADALGLPRTAVTHLETGKRAVSTLELTELSKLYMRPVASFFEEPEGEEEPMVAILRVLDNFADNPQVQVEIAAALAVCRDAVGLKVLLGLSSNEAPPVHSLTTPNNSAEAVAQGEAVARAERRRLALGASPIADMADLMNGAGVWATGAELPDEMSGLFIHHSSVGLLVLANLDHPRARKRFSYAHEYAHVLLDREPGVSASTRDKNPELCEKRANAFAAAFLMPRSGVSEELAHLGKGTGSRDTSTTYDVNTEEAFATENRKKPNSQTITFQDIAGLSLHFGVSYAAMTYRLSSLGFVSKSQRPGLLEQAELGHSYLQSLQAEPRADSPDRELQREVARLAFEAYRLEEISRGKLIEVCSRLGISATDVETQMQALRQGK